MTPQSGEDMDIIRRPRGAHPETVKLDTIQVPDAWHAAMRLLDDGEDRMSEIVIDTWHLAHDLLYNLQRLDADLG